MSQPVEVELAAASVDYWVSRGGEVHLISELPTSYLMNVIRFLKHDHDDGYNQSWKYRHLQDELASREIPVTFEDALDQQLEILRKTILTKHKDYGVGNILNTPFKPETVIAVRLNEKVARLANLVDGDGKPEHESLQDTALDIVGYGIVLQMVLNNTFGLESEK